MNRVTHWMLFAAVVGCATGTQPKGKEPEATEPEPIASEPEPAAPDAAASNTGTISPTPEPTVVESEQPADWDADIAPVLAEDLNPDPNVLEVNIAAREAEIEILPGLMTRLWTYNGSVPGPLLRLKRGDRLIVHFTNHLPEATTLHWHGLRVPAAMDGTPAMQNPVEPGESFNYDFVVPDAGTFWYHPHINSSTQVGYGLYGPLLIDDPEEDPIEVDDLVLVLSDLALDEEGQLQPGDRSHWFGDYFGREGEVLLVNGKVQPRLFGRAGVPQRWRIINAARARFFQVVPPGASLVRVAGDAGLSEHPQNSTTIRLVPSERGEFIVTPSAAGAIEVLAEDADRFNLGVPQPSQTLFHFVVEEPTEENNALKRERELPSPLRQFPDFALDQAKSRRIELNEMVLDGQIHLAIDGRVHSAEHLEHLHHHTADYVAFVGDTEIWEVVNTTDYAHPFHLHGFSFEVLDVAGQPWPVREWKDTVNVPARQSLRFAVTFDDRPGLWMFHCHILDHVNLGMMATLEVRSTP